VEAPRSYRNISAPSRRPTATGHGIFSDARNNRINTVNP
jgi:hypothetical protein